MPGLARSYGPNDDSTGAGGSAPGRIEYTPPGYDEKKVRAYQQEAMAPGISGLRRLTREAQARRYTSPTARREAMRGLARGYGEALAPLQVGAGAQARQRYDIQYRQAVRAEEQRVASEERAAEQAYQEEQQAEDRVIVGYNASGNPIYMTSQEAEGYYGAVEAERGLPSQVIGITEASRRPISDEPTYGRSLYPESVSPEPAYPTNWMT